MTDLKWLSVSQAAAYLQCHQQTIMNYLRKGILVSSQITPKGKHRISAESIEELLMKGKL